MRREPGILGLRRRSFEKLGGEGSDILPELRVDALPIEGGRSNHQFAHQLWVPDGDLLGGVTAHAVPEDIRLFDAEILQQRGNVIGKLRIGERTIDVSGTSMAL